MIPELAWEYGGSDHAWENPEHGDVCIGGFGNLEILSDTASLGDGRDLGFSLAEVSTELRLRLSNGKTTRLALIE